MRLSKLIRMQIRRAGPGVQAAGDINAAISANVNEPGSTHTSVRSYQRIVQRSGRESSGGHKRPEADA